MINKSCTILVQNLTVYNFKILYICNKTVLTKKLLRILNLYILASRTLFMSGYKTHVLCDVQYKSKNHFQRQIKVIFK